MKLSKKHFRDAAALIISQPNLTKHKFYKPTSKNYDMMGALAKVSKMDTFYGLPGYEFFHELDTERVTKAIRICAPKVGIERSTSMMMLMRFNDRKETTPMTAAHFLNRVADVL